MRYKISCIDPNQHLLRIELRFKTQRKEEIDLRIPAWRPGRYQMAHFARNIMRMEAFSAKDDPLRLSKVEKDRWVLHTEGYEEIKVIYSYYAHKMDAGSSYVDEEQLYINPVSSFIYLPDRTEEEHRIELELPEDHEVATGLKKEDRSTLLAKDLQTLMDGPFIASAGLKHHAFEEKGARFHLWFQGECKPDFRRIERDFRGFIVEQVAAFGEFPEPEYHFLFQILPYRTFHGVEHENSTVIVLGPSYTLMKDGYEAFVAVSSHELYHTWNVKRIRPSAMMPYDFTQENYTRLGYVAEGVTTYMGDLMLLRSGFYSLERYLEKFSKLLQRHFDNAGRHNRSVADSSFDTWLDGYDREVPGRKVSIYNEGALIAFILDIRIRKCTGDERSLDDLMRRLYEEHYLKGKGFSEEELKAEAEDLAGSGLEDLWKDLIGGVSDYAPFLQESFAHLGIEWESEPSERYHEAWLGFRVRDEKGAPVIASLQPGSPAEKAGLEIGDRLIGVNGYEIGVEDLSPCCEYFSDEGGLGLTLARDGRILERTIGLEGGPYFRIHRLRAPELRSAALQSWCASLS